MNTVVAAFIAAERTGATSALSEHVVLAALPESDFDEDAGRDYGIHARTLKA